MLLHFKKISFKLSTEEKKEIDRVIEENRRKRKIRRRNKEENRDYCF